MWEAITTPTNLVFAAGFMFVMGYLIINQVILRLFVLGGTCLYLWYYATVSEMPLWDAIYTSFAMGLANILGLFGLYARQAPWSIPSAHRDLYEQFNALPPGDFRALMREAKRYRLEADTTILREGTPNESLVFLVEGHARIEKMGTKWEMTGGWFFGEAGYLLERSSAATVTLTKGSEIVEWKRERVAKIAKRKPRFKLALDAAIARDMAIKVTYAVAPNQKAAE